MPTSNPNSWGTPQPLYDSLNDQRGPFVLDAAASATNAKTDLYFTKENDALCQDWHATVTDAGGGAAWLNPPYSDPGPWMAKAVQTAQTGTRVVALVRGSLSVRWWHAHVMPHASEVLAVDGRLRFIHPDSGQPGGTAPFESVVVVFDPDDTGPLTLGSISRDGGPICRRAARREEQS